MPPPRRRFSDRRGACSTATVRRSATASPPCITPPTWSWEPGPCAAATTPDACWKRSKRCGPQLAADTRFHLRHETYNLDAETENRGLVVGRTYRPVRLQRPYGFDGRQPRQAAECAGRHGGNAPVSRATRSTAWWKAWSPAPMTCRPRIARAWRRAAREANVRMLSHDDDSPEIRRAFRSQGRQHRRIFRSMRQTAAGGSQRRRLHRVRGAQCRAWRQAIPAGPRRPT